MGYTVYWTSVHSNTETFKKFVEMATKVINPAIYSITNESTFQFDSPNGNGGETFFVFQYKNGFSCCKTSREPYTVDVFKCLVLMVDLGMAKDICADDTESFYVALDAVHAKYPLNTYEKQKRMFNATHSIV